MKEVEHGSEDDVGGGFREGADAAVCPNRSDE